VLEAAQERFVVAVNPDLLKLLVCPECKTPVRPVEEDTGLRCDSCGRTYPVRDDIPVMLLEEAKS
jgi:uncharacterized protein YbaR (Trm112 family)